MTALATQTYSAAAARSRRDALILDHLPLVRQVIGRLVARLPAGVDADNLTSAGTLGLVEAANKFDPERGVGFKTFAHARIRGAVLDELRRNSALPQQVLEHIALVRAAYRDLPAPATVEALAVETGLSADDVVACLAAMRLTRTVSLHQAPEAAEGRPTRPEEQPAYQAEQAEQKRLLAAAIAELPERERVVVSLYYLEDLRLKEIGEVLGLSESRVSRILDGALFMLGESLRDKAG